jgi:hypothetical protein
MSTPKSGSTDRGMGTMINFKIKPQLESEPRSFYSKDQRKMSGDVIKTIATERIVKSKDVFRPGIFKRKIGIGMIDANKSGSPGM